MNILTCVIVFAIIHATLELRTVTDPEAAMNTMQIIAYHGYPCQSHQVTTDDDYILTMHRIPHGIKDQQDSSKPVVFLQHGLLDSSFTWVSNPPSQSLGYILADLGYDVWLGNTRGNVYSKSHTRFHPSSNKFWDFTWDEMAKYDLPAMVNYVLTISKVPKLSYVGHSQGTLIAFAKLSENGTLNSQISSFVAIAPVPYIGHTKAGSRHVAMLAGGLNIIDQILNHGEFLPNSNFMSVLRSLQCTKTMNDTACDNVLFLMNGYDVSNINTSRLSVYLAHVPAGTSSKNILHYAQSYRSDSFQMYDRGILGNMWYYGRTTPPKYPVNTYDVPVAIFHGGKDKSAAPEDVERTILELGKCVAFKKFIPSYNHIDFLWGVNATNVVYRDMISFIERYQ